MTVAEALTHGTILKRNIQHLRKLARNTDGAKNPALQKLKNMFIIQRRPKEQEQEHWRGKRELSTRGSF